MNPNARTISFGRFRAIAPVAPLPFTFAAFLLATPLAAHAADGFTDPGSLGGGTTPYAVSADGSVVVGLAYTGGLNYHAFHWSSSGGMVDLGTLGGTNSYATGASADGAVVVGAADTVIAQRAFRWTSAGGMVDLGTLGGAYSRANGVSADGSVVVGTAYTAGNAFHAFRWTSGGMVDLGTLGGSESEAFGVSADGSVVVGTANTVGNAANHAFRWTSGGMVDLGTLGGTYSTSYGVSADGTVAVGYSYLAGDGYARAFRWTSGGGMADLGTLGGNDSYAWGVSANGAVVVGDAQTGTAWRAFRWSASTGMQSVEDWLRANGVVVPVDVTEWAGGTNADGSVVVGRLASGRAFIARVAPVGSGLVTLADVQQSLSVSASAGGIALRAADTVINGAHSRPLSRRVAAGQRTFWLAGDWGRDDHGTRNGDLGLAEVGLGHNFGPMQVNVSLGQTWATQHLALNGHARTDGTYLLAEALIPVAGNLWATVGGYNHSGNADLKRGYLNAGQSVASTASSDVDTWGLRARLDWEKAFAIAGTDLAPYLDLSHAQAKLDAYTETGGGFPARFDARKDKATELRLGVNAAKPLDNGVRLLGTLEAAHRFEENGARTTGEMIGLFGFDLPGQKNKRDWLRAGVGVEGKLAGGTASLSVNVTTRGEMPNYWLAANWQMAF